MSFKETKKTKGLKTKILSTKFNEVVFFWTSLITLGIVAILGISSSHAADLPKNNPLNVAPLIYNPMDVDQVERSNKVTIDLPSAFEEGQQQEWVEISQTLRTAVNTEFTLRVTGMGGEALMLNNFIRALQDSQAKGNIVNMDIIGPAASAHAFITCFANKVTLRDGASLLFHQAYGMSSLFFGLVQVRELASEPMIMAISNLMLNTCVKNGRLTLKDVQVIKSGDDVTIVKEGAKYVKLYSSDGASIINYTIPSLVEKLSNILAVLMVLGSLCYVIRKAGKR